MGKNKIIITCFSKSGNTLALFICFVYTGNISKYGMFIKAGGIYAI